MAGKPDKKAAKDLTVTLSPNRDTPQTRIYANFAQVSQTPYDFNLMFCDATPISINKSADGKITHDIPIVAEIAIPFHLVPGLINALQIQYDLYRNNVSGDTNEKKPSKS